MEPWFEIYLKYYGLFLFTVILLFISGRIILCFLAPLIKVSGFYQKIFFSLALGVFSTVIISSIVVTHFITISSGFLLISLFLIYELFKFRSEKNEIFTIKSLEENHSNKKNVFKISGLILLSLFFYSWQAVMIFKGGAFPFIVPEHDYVFYADLFEMIWKTGQENTYQSGNLISEKFFGIIPYHYFEMWLGAFFSSFYNIENLLSMQLITIPVFFFMMAVSIFSVAESFAIITILKQIVILPLLFIGGIPFIPDHSSGYFQWVTNIESPLFIEKAAHYYWIAMIGFLFILNNSFMLCFIVFISIIFVSGTTIPAIFSGGALFLLVSFILKIQNRGELKKEAVYFALSILFFCAFYFVFGNSKFSFKVIHPLLYYTDLSPVLNIGFDFFTLKVMIVELIVRIYKTPFEILLVILPFILSIILLQKMEIKKLNLFKLPFVFICCIYISSLICYGVFYKMWDSVQFCENIYFFILSFLSVVIIFSIVEPITLVKKISIVSLLVIFIIKISIYLYNRNLQRSIHKNIYSDEYLLEISSSKNENNQLGVFFRSQPDSERVTGRNSQIEMRIGGYTDFFPQFSQTVDLSLIEMTNWDVGRWGELEQAIVKTSTFYQYVEDQKRKNKYKSIAQSQVDFIDDHGIKYVIVSKNAKMNPLIEERAIKVISDSKSGERFLILE